MDWSKIAPMFLADVEGVLIASVIAMSRTVWARTMLRTKNKDFCFISESVEL